MNSTHLKLAIAALRMIALGLGILALLVAVGIIKLSVFTVKAIALGIKALNAWCDAQIDADPGFAPALSGFSPVAMLAPAPAKVLVTKPVLPSSGAVIAIAPREYQPVWQLAENLFNSPAPKKRGRPSKKLAIGFA
jgi:hypothetical protein